MAKLDVVCLFVVAASLIGLASAQSSKTHSPAKVPPSSTRSGPDPLQAATKPLTPKSAMPTKRKSSVVVGDGGTRGRKATAELTQLEQQNVKAESAKATPAKAAPASKSSDTSPSRGSQIDFQYQKPVGGLKATTPNSKSANSGAPRVKKN